MRSRPIFCPRWEYPPESSHPARWQIKKEIRANMMTKI
jgi:hypothetical protein